MSIPCKMNPLGEGRGGERFPLGYKRLEYLESTGTQNILIPYTVTYSTGLYLKGQLSSAVTETGMNYPFSGAKSNFPCTMLGLYAPGWKNQNGWLYSWGKYSGNANVLSGVDYSLFEAWNNWDSLKFVKVINCRTLDIFSRTTPDSWVWGAENENNFEATAQDFNLFNNSKFRIYRASIQQDFNEVTRNFIPALDPSGRPCMFDTVSRKPFYNAATTGSDFIAGMTIKQARHLAYLPATGGSLTISLPLAAAFDEKVQNALNKAAEKGWAFTFYWTDVIEYLTPRINAIVGEGNYTIAFDYNAQKVSLAFELSVTSEQVDEVRTLLESELPDNIVVQIEYYTPLEYLYAASKEYIDTGIIHANDIGMIYEVERTSKSDSYLAGVMDENELFSASPARYVPGLNYRPSWAGMSDFGWGTCPADLPLVKTVGSVNFLNNRKATLENEYVSKEQELETLQTGLNWKNWTLFTLHNPPRSWSGRGRIYWAKFSRGNEMIAHFVPALNQEGQPGMYDTVSKVFKTNSGTGDFLYPGAEQAVTTLDLDLDAKSYAKLTEHGVRRLYHVPKGCNMTKDEYAAVNGFKELIEPPMPLEGYWTPQWRETETQLVCDWVETDPPAESLEEP